MQEHVTKEVYSPLPTRVVLIYGPNWAKIVKLHELARQKQHNCYYYQSAKKQCAPTGDYAPLHFLRLERR